MSVSQSQFFSYDELKCKCGCGKCEMNESFMERLDELRTLCGHPIYLSSAYRCPEHNSEVGGVDDSPHPEGIGVDITINGGMAWHLLDYATEIGFTGIGIKQHGKHKKRFIHIDDKPNGTRPWVWSYK